MVSESWKTCLQQHEALLRQSAHAVDNSGSQILPKPHIWGIRWNDT